MSCDYVSNAAAVHSRIEQQIHSPPSRLYFIPFRRPEQGFMRGLAIVGLDNVVASTFITVDANTITNINVIIPAHDSHSLHETKLVKN